MQLLFISSEENQISRKQGLISAQQHGLFKLIGNENPNWVQLLFSFQIDQVDPPMGFDVESCLNEATLICTKPIPGKILSGLNNKILRINSRFS